MIRVFGYFGYFAAFVALCPFVDTISPNSNPLVVIVAIVAIDMLSSGPIQRTLDYLARYVPDIPQTVLPMANTFKTIRKRPKSALSELFTDISGNTTMLIMPERTSAPEPEQLVLRTKLSPELIKKLVMTKLGEMVEGSTFGEAIKSVNFTQELVVSRLQDMLAGSRLGEIYESLTVGTPWPPELGEYISGSYLGNLFMGTKAEQEDPNFQIGETAFLSRLRNKLIAPLSDDERQEYLDRCLRIRRIGETPIQTYAEKCFSSLVGSSLENMLLEDSIKNSKLGDLIFKEPSKRNIVVEKIKPVIESILPVTTTSREKLDSTPTIPSMDVSFDTIKVSIIAAYIFLLLFGFGLIISLYNYLYSWNKVIEKAPLPPGDIPPPAGSPPLAATGQALPRSSKASSEVSEPAEQYHLPPPLNRLPSMNNLLAYILRPFTYLRRPFAYILHPLTHIRRLLLNLQLSIRILSTRIYSWTNVHGLFVYLDKKIAYIIRPCAYCLRLLKSIDRIPLLNQMRFMDRLIAFLHSPLGYLRSAGDIIHLCALIGPLFAWIGVKLEFLRTVADVNRISPLVWAVDAIEYICDLIIRFQYSVFRVIGVISSTINYFVFSMMGWEVEFFGGANYAMEVLMVFRTIRSHLWTRPEPEPRPRPHRRGREGALSRHHFPGFAKSRHRSLPHPQCEHFSTFFIHS
ncbi:hypothetical protein NHQ30_001792 [Ciborinia camelliae]|nr:hypothetical protein NHQ30_001792 [Ciborinia camelliae]